MTKYKVELFTVHMLGEESSLEFYTSKGVFNALRNAFVNLTPADYHNFESDQEGNYFSVDNVAVIFTEEED